MDDYPDMERGIEILSGQTFEDLHKAILESVNFDDSQLASFFICDENWNEQLEITLIDMSDEVEHSFNPTMAGTKIEEYVKEEKANFKYIYDFAAMWNFKAELIELKDKASKKVVYPAVVEKNGDAPTQYDEQLLLGELSEEDESLLEELRSKNHEILTTHDEFEDEFGLDEDEEENPWDAGFDEYEGGGHGKDDW